MMINCGSILPGPICFLAFLASSSSRRAACTMSSVPHGVRLALGTHDGTNY